MNEIKAIETEYNGYRFRSRLEARWAVYFDACGIEYLYENQGYQLQDGSKYLPDFEVKEYSDDWWWFFECKGRDDPEGIRKACLLDSYPPDGFVGVIIAHKPPEEIDHVQNEYFQNEMELIVQRLGIPRWLSNKAAIKARQARFEHGEKPIIERTSFYLEDVFQ